MEVSHVFKTCVYFLLNRQQSSTTLINNNHPRISLISPFHELGYLLKLCSNLLAHLVSLVIFKNKFSFLKTLFSKNIKFHNFQSVFTKIISLLKLLLRKCPYTCLFTKITFVCVRSGLEHVVPFDAWSFENTTCRYIDRQVLNTFLQVKILLHKFMFLVWQSFTF